jgi:4'-phosphopantetheinyl transferase
VTTLPGRREIHLHRFGLDLDGEELLGLVETVSEDERARAERAVDSIVRRRRIASRGLVRRTLAAYLGVAPGSIRISHGVHGKPFVTWPDTRLRFSVSTADDLCVLVVAAGADLGVDVERVVSDRALGPIAESLFSRDEAAELRRLEDRRRVPRFFEHWTRKEAVAKALGVGLSVPLRLLMPPAGWTVCAIPVAPGYAGALCVRGRRPQLVLVQ